MAVVNSGEEAQALRDLYFTFGPPSEERGNGGSRTAEGEIPEEEITPTPEPADAQVHIGIHDRFIEGEYLTVRGK